MKLKLGAKVGLGFGIVLLLMLTSAVISYSKSQNIAAMQTLMAEMRSPSVYALKDLRGDLHESQNKVRQVALAGSDRARSAKGRAAYDSNWTSVENDIYALQALSPRWTDPKRQQTLASIAERIPALHQEQEQAMQMAASGAKDAIVDAGNFMADKVTPQNDAIGADLATLANGHIKAAAETQAAVRASLTSMIWTTWITTVVALLIAASTALYLSRSMSTAASAVLKRSEAIASGDLSGPEIHISTRDELGDIAAAMNHMQSNLRSMIVSVSENAKNVSHASEELSAVSQQIGANSEETSAQADTVSAATEQVNRNLQSVATATEEMSASIHDIAKNASEAAKVAAEAMKTATETNAIMSKLGDSSAAIGQVIKVITSIAQKTDLLALNATVEAARAGEVGAGFAVVANEVKELAKQTAIATEDISKKIAAIQMDAKGAVGAIQKIGEIIQQVNSISATIAAAVEEQSATTSEMSRNLTEAAKGSGDVAHNISGVAQAAQNTSHGATDSQKAARGLEQMSTQLRDLVKQFNVETNGHTPPKSKARSHQDAELVEVRTHEPSSSADFRWSSRFS